MSKEIKLPPVIFAKSLEDYYKMPDPYKNELRQAVNLLELAKYAERVQKPINELTAKEILQFKLPDYPDDEIIFPNK